MERLVRKMEVRSQIISLLMGKGEELQRPGRDMEWPGSGQGPGDFCVI